METRLLFCPKRIPSISRHNLFFPLNHHRRLLSTPNILHLRSPLSSPSPVSPSSPSPVASPVDLPLIFQPHFPSCLSIHTTIPHPLHLRSRISRLSLPPSAGHRLRQYHHCHQKQSPLGPSSTTQLLIKSKGYSLVVEEGDVAPGHVIGFGGGFHSCCYCLFAIEKHATDGLGTIDYKVVVGGGMVVNMLQMFSLLTCSLVVISN
ncbi:unnamed protein product [Lactuca saligna]|uniref:Uncharacterized protein n=1 Tax=Lactuca saligna TaxID=75948 RepID=A0AA35ZTQ6_LACSI|nr:unnamed protein product [Lactuca saligna]